MEYLDLPSSLVYLWDLKQAIEKQQSIHLGIKLYISRNRSDAFSKMVMNWYALLQTKESVHSSQNSFRDKNISTKGQTIFHKQLIEISILGLKGVPVYDNLRELEKEIITQCEMAIATHVARLPLILQIPLMGLIFPAFMIILVIPALSMMQFS